MSSQTDAPTKPVTHFPTPEEGFGLHIILTLAYWRNKLRGTDIEFPEYDYITPLGEECTLLYMAMWVDNEYRVLPFRGVRPRNPWSVYPVDRRRFDAGTQTEDADTTLVEIDAPDSKSRSYAQVVLDDPQATDRHQFDPSTQTKDADMTLAGNDPLASDSKLCSEAQVALDDGKEPCEERNLHKDKKRKSKTEDVGSSQNGFKTCDVVVQRLQFGKYPPASHSSYSIQEDPTWDVCKCKSTTHGDSISTHDTILLSCSDGGTRSSIPLLQPITDNPAPPSVGTFSIRSDIHLVNLWRGPCPGSLPGSRASHECIRIFETLFGATLLLFLLC
ncbi:hypothetical protein EDB85DRAFT_1895800 [Lactarius pseudohatsudake]|nr:hypothetical protein EDB85DRAFT_1895800 [Lactarius pseudohatsudake]